MAKIYFLANRTRGFIIGAIIVLSKASENISWAFDDFISAVLPFFHLFTCTFAKSKKSENVCESVLKLLVGNDKAKIVPYFIVLQFIYLRIC